MSVNENVCHNGVEYSDVRFEIKLGSFLSLISNFLSTADVSLYRGVLLRTALPLIGCSIPSRISKGMTHVFHRNRWLATCRHLK